MRFLKVIYEWLRPARFARYRLVPRLGTRRIECLLLGRIASHPSVAVVAIAESYGP